MAIADRIKNLAAILSALLLMLLPTFFAACGGDGWRQDTVVTGVLRDKSFAPLSEDIYFDGEKVGTSAADGSFEITVSDSSQDGLTTKLGLGEGSKSFVYMQYGENASTTVIVKCDTDFSIDDYYMLSGKIVLHSDGETAAGGTELRIDGNRVARDESARDFDVPFVHKDSIISVYKEGYISVDSAFLPYNERCLSEALAETQDLAEVYVNGLRTNLKQVGGVTFRMAESTSRR